MKFLAYLNFFIFILLLGLFIWQLTLSIFKYLSWKTSFYNTVAEEETNLYPSVTVCKKYTFDSYLDYMFQDTTSSSADDIKKAVLENSWGVEEVFYFFTHPGMFGLRYPCTTMIDGSDPGKPCEFPYKEYSAYDYTYTYYLGKSLLSI